MLPVLFPAFGYDIRSYGFFMAMGHLIGVALLLASARAHRQPIAPFLDLLFAVIIFGLLGARAGYAFNHWGEFREDPLRLLSFSQGGLSFYGGFPFAFVAFVAVLRWRRIPVLATSDYVSPILPFTLGLIRLGCFLQGCCYGAPTSVPWAVTSTHLESEVPIPLLHRPLHPTQLYEVGFLFTLTLALVWLLRRRIFPTPGTVATFSIFAYSVYRFFGDSFRGDIERGFLGISWLGSTQAAAFMGILSTPVVLWICSRAGRRRA